MAELHDILGLEWIFLEFFSGRLNKSIMCLISFSQGWVRIPAEENKADPAPSAVPSTALVPSTASVPSGQSVETEITVVEEEQDAPISSSQP